jgi:hypothetical protein
MSAVNSWTNCLVQLSASQWDLATASSQKTLCVRLFGVWRVKEGRAVGINWHFRAQWSVYAPLSGLCMYRSVVSVCTAQWSVYVPLSGLCMYRSVVSVCTAQWSVYAPLSGLCMYRSVVSVCTTSLTFNNSTFCPHSVFMFCVDLRTNGDYFPTQH